MSFRARDYSGRGTIIICTKDLCALCIENVALFFTEFMVFYCVFNVKIMTIASENISRNRFIFLKSRLILA